MAPDRHVTDRATGDFLPLSALRRRYHDLGRASEKLHAVGFDHRIQRKRCPRFALTPAAVAAVDEHGAAAHAIPYRSASTPTVQQEVTHDVHLPFEYGKTRTAIVGRLVRYHKQSGPDATFSDAACAGAVVSHTQLARQNFRLQGPRVVRPGWHAARVLSALSGPRQWTRTRQWGRQLSSGTS